MITVFEFRFVLHWKQNLNRMGIRERKHVWLDTMECWGTCGQGGKDIALKNVK